MPALKKSREEKMLDLIGRCLRGETNKERLCREMGVCEKTLANKSADPGSLTLEKFLAVAPMIGLEIEIRPKGI